jgi:NAD(P)-dependent dehydrogenase (short-subunit alcohol dehydrogenase family)
MRLSGRVALITGASRGIGEAIARRFASEGASVCLSARGEERCAEIAAEIAASGGEAFGVACDVTSRGAASAAVSAAVERWGRIDILVNNAGISGLTPLVGGEWVGDTWDRILATNLTAAFAISRLVLPSMPDGGRIIFQSSVLGRFGVPGYAAYVAAKHGVIGLTRTMALELAPRKITVNAICPGWVETELGREGFGRIAAAQGITVEEARALAGKMAPLGAVLEPAEIAALAAYIASPEARNLTGQAIVLDGGQVMP